jgi:hypothetical protein
MIIKKLKRETKSLQAKMSLISKRTLRTKTLLLRKLIQPRNSRLLWNKRRKEDFRSSPSSDPLIKSTSLRSNFNL